VLIEICAFNKINTFTEQQYYHFHSYLSGRKMNDKL